MTTTGAGAIASPTHFHHPRHPNDSIYTYTYTYTTPYLTLAPPAINTISINKKQILYIIINDNKHIQLKAALGLEIQLLPLTRPIHQLD